MGDGSRSGITKENRSGGSKQLIGARQDLEEVSRTSRVLRSSQSIFHDDWWVELRQQILHCYTAGFYSINHHWHGIGQTVVTTQCVVCVFGHP